MIVPSMTNLEVYNELAADLPKLKIRANTLMAKVVKEFRKVRRFPSWQCYEYTHQESKNKYLISFYAASSKQIEKPAVDYMGVTSDSAGRVIMKWETWLYRKDDTVDFIATRAISYYCGHFFSRYRERVWPNVEMSANELICRYFTRNKRPTPIKLNEDIKQRYQEYGEFAQYAMQVTDGICFTDQGCEGDESTVGDRNGNFISCVWYYTIVSKSMLTDRQTGAIAEEEKEFVRSHFFEPFKMALEKEIRKLPPQLRPPFLNDPI